MATLYDAFSTTCGCHLTHSQNYRSQIDPSDRSVISYLLGGISAKLAASLLVGVPYLVHYDAVLKANGLTLRGRRPDFVGVGNPPVSARVTVEAKGTAGPVNSALADAVEQAKGGGHRSRHRRLAWGQQAHFQDLGWGELVWSAHLLDPPSEDFVFPQPEDVLIAYFAPLIRDVFGEESREIGEEGNRWQMAELADVGVQIAIRSDVVAAAEQGDGAALIRLCGLTDRGQHSEEPTADEILTTLAYDPAQYWGLPPWPTPANADQSFVGPDGVAVRIAGDSPAIGRQNRARNRQQRGKR